MKIKICGLRCREDVELVNALRPEYAGFVFATGRHQVMVNQAQELRQLLAPGIISVGVFVNEAIDIVSAIAKQTGLEVLQLHGEETPAYIRKLRRQTHLPIVKAIRLGARSVKSSELQALAAAGVGSFLFDTASAAGYGGTGQSFNLNLLEQMEVNIPFFVAGGLSATTVTSVIQTVQAGKHKQFFKGVDVSSAVETQGKKDKIKTAAFIKAVRENSEAETIGVAAGKERME